MLAVPMVASAARLDEPKHAFLRKMAVKCEHCGYDLSGGTSSGRCPECGMAKGFSARMARAHQVKAAMSRARWLIVAVLAGVGAAAYVTGTSVGMNNALASLTACYATLSCAAGAFAVFELLLVVAAASLTILCVVGALAALWLADPKSGAGIAMNLAIPGLLGFAAGTLLRAAIITGRRL